MIYGGKGRSAIILLYSNYKVEDFDNLGKNCIYCCQYEKKKKNGMRSHGGL
jgi:hypothetical protein